MQRPQSIWPAGQPHAVALPGPSCHWQRAPPVHLIPQAPQLSSSRVVVSQPLSTTPSQSSASSAALHCITQLPATQENVSHPLPVGQVNPHAPQLFGSSRRLTSHGKRELGHVVQPGGQLFVGQYAMSSRGSGSASGPASTPPN